MRAIITTGLALKGGSQLVREMMQPLPASPNAAELDTNWDSMPNSDEAAHGRTGHVGVK